MMESYEESNLQRNVHMKHKKYRHQKIKLENI